MSDASVKTYDFNSGVQTSQVPDTGVVTNPDDNITKAYGDANYTPISSYGASVSNIAALKAIGSASRFNGQTVKVYDVGTGGTFYQFDSASAAAGDDDTVVEPTSGTGRWIKGAGGSGSGSSGGGIDGAAVKMELEYTGIISEDTEGAVLKTGAQQSERAIVGNLLKAATASDTSIGLVWNAQPDDAADPNMDSASLYSGVAAGTNVSTSSSSPKWGTNWITFDKTTGNTAAELLLTLAAVAAIKNPIKFYTVNLPSITGLNSIGVKIYGSSTSDFAQWNVTDRLGGTGFVAGDNIIAVDLRTTPSTTGGSSWVYSAPSRYRGLVLNTATSGQTYSGVKVDTACYSEDPAEYGYIGEEITINDNSNREAITIDSSNTLLYGFLTLASAIGNGYAAGLSGASIARVLRSTLTSDSNGILNEEGLSGNIDTTQEIRMSRIFPETVNGSYNMFVDTFTRQIYPVTAVGGSSVDVTDPAVDTANLVNGNKIDFFRPYYSGGKKFARWVASKTITGSSASGGTTTMNISSPSPIAVGDIAVKRFISLAVSSVNLGSNESFTSAPVDESAAGLKLIDTGIRYPNSPYVWADYHMGDITDALATRNFKGVGPGLTKNGTPNLQQQFQNGYFSGTTWTTSNYLSLTTADSAAIRANSNGPINISMWVYLDSTPGADGFFIDNGFSSGSAWAMYITTGRVLTLTVDNVVQSATPALSNGAWHHVYARIVGDGSGTNYFYVNGVKYSGGTTAANTSTSNFLHVGQRGNGNNPFDTGRIGRTVIWLNAPDLVAADAQNIYSGGKFKNFGYSPQLRTLVSVNGLSGDKFSAKVTSTRTTSAVANRIRKIGLVPA